MRGRERFLTVKQPWASLVMAGGKDVENRPKPVPSTLPQWFRCTPCGERRQGLENSNADHDCTPAGTWWRDGAWPFRMWIHAGKAFDMSARRLFWDEFQAGTISPFPPRGVLLGHVTVTGCHYVCAPVTTKGLLAGDRRLCSPWAQPDAFHWTLADPVALPEPIPMRGQLGLPFMPDAVLAAALAQLEGRAA